MEPRSLTSSRCSNHRKIHIDAVSDRGGGLRLRLGARKRKDLSVPIQDSDHFCSAPVRPGSAVLIPSRHYPAVHIPDRSSYPRSLVGQQEADDFGDVLRTADSADGVEAVEALK